MFTHITNAAIHFKELVSKLQFTLSSKKGAGSIIASTPFLARQIKETLKQNCINYEVESTARDLGILYTAGKANPSQFSHNRLLRTRPRTTKTLSQSIQV